MAPARPRDTQGPQGTWGGCREGSHAYQGTNEEACVGRQQGTHEGQEGLPEVDCDELLAVGRDEDGETAWRGAGKVGHGPPTPCEHDRLPREVSGLANQWHGGVPRRRDGVGPCPP